MLDPALLAPGVSTRASRWACPSGATAEHPQLHCRAKPLDEDVDLDRLAADTVYFSGASLESLVNEAAIRARRSSPVITRATSARRWSPAVGAEREAACTPADERLIALHEAGHAVALPPAPAKCAA